MQVYNDELYHHGVIGMKWGHHKLKIGVSDKGNISLFNGTNNKEGVKKFLLKSSIFTSTVGLSVYISKHPRVIIKGHYLVSKILQKDKIEPIIKDSYIFSKKLGRFLTVEEATLKGFM
jgi:hypothetical protein